MWWSWWWVVDGSSGEVGDVVGDDQMDCEDTTRASPATDTFPKQLIGPSSVDDADPDTIPKQPIGPSSVDHDNTDPKQRIGDFSGHEAIA